jgi:methyl-accepting chemotaxis protein
MGKKVMKQSRFGISVRTSIFSGLTVLVLLMISSVIFLKLELGLVDYLIGEHSRGMETAIDEQARNEKTDLSENMKVNAEICSGIASNFLFNFDEDGLAKALSPYMKLPSIRAIRVLDNKEKPFLAIWKAPKIQTGKDLPKDLALNNDLAWGVDSVYEKEKIGQVRIFFTDVLVNTKIQKNKEQIKKEIAAFQETADKSFRKALIGQIGVTLGVVLALVITISLCLRIIAINPLNRIIAGLQDAAEQVAEASAQVASSSQDMAQGASEQASGIEEMCSTLEEISSMTRRNADNASQVNRIMGDESAENFHRIKAQMEKMKAAIASTVESSQETAKIIKTIDEIAFQTNLLALNAAVEAARAGEAGAGFAVVADEVRNLAMRAAEAAKTTSELIKHSSVRIQETSELNARMVEVMDQNSSIAQKVTTLVGEIAAASQEQAQGVEQTNLAAMEMERVTQSSAAGAEESASASQEMSAQAEEVQAFVGDLVSIVSGTGRRGSKIEGRSTKKGHEYQEDEGTDFPVVIADRKRS